MAGTKNSLTFNGIRKPWLIAGSTDRRKPIFAPINRNIETVPGRPGGLYNSRRTQREVLTIDQPITIVATDNEDAMRKAEELVSWLYTEEPAPLEFDSEPGRVYFALLDGSTDLTQLGRFRKGTLTFICPDPFKYGNEKTATITGGSILEVGGNVETRPVIEVTMNAPSSYVAVGTGDKMNMIGRSIEENERPAERLERVYWSEADTISGWTPATTSEEGSLGGAIESTGFVFRATGYGTGTGWHGPALKRGIPETLTDFQVDALVDLTNLPDFNKRGKVVVSGLDATNRVVFMMSMGDGYSTPKAQGLIRAGDKGTGTNVLAHIGEPPAWNNFKGRLRVGRIGNDWFAYVARHDMRTGADSVRMYRTFRGEGAQYQRPLAQIQVQLMAHSTAPVATPRLEDVKVYKINNLASNEVPIIAEAGDVIVFDHQNGVILKDMDDMTPEKAFIGEYFPLLPGKHPLIAEPADSIESVRVRWRDRWQ